MSTVDENSNKPKEVEVEGDPNKPKEVPLYKTSGFWFGIITFAMLIGGIIALVVSLNKHKVPSQSFINMPSRSNILYNQLV
jgi:hypothetical protein